ncbi:MAG TPA: metalloregulator ArsR/SmtB family transcription factor [Asticcacaulis sp.]|nr:metalloregulator ArsR/SmtB family transcription factor [Asticcacaulis sp.]
MRKDLSPMILAANAQKATRLLKLMASEQRLMILCKLGEGEQSAGELTELVGLSQSAASQHLQKMKAEGLVDTRRDAQTIYYRLADDAAGQVIDLLCKIYGAEAK